MSTTPKLESMLTDKIGRIVDRHILPIFKSGAKVTVLVRHPGFDDADVVVTSDDDTGVHAIVERRFAATPSALSAAPEGEAVAWSTGIVWGLRQSEMVVKLTRRQQPEYGFDCPLFAAPQSPAPEAVLVDAESDAFIAAYMAACEGRAPDHNEIGLHYFKAGATLSAGKGVGE